MANYNGCDIIDAAISGMVSKMDALNNKVAGLRRLAQLIEQASDPRTLIPDINRLVPLDQIDVQSYENLRASCPFLNLPSAAAGIALLKSDLNQAYNALIAKLNLHPFLQLQRLVDQIDRFIAQSGVNYGCVLQYLQCAQAACKAAGNISATLERNAVIVEEYGKNILNTTAAVVSERGQAKITEIKNVISQVENLSKP
jgi:hypothetical protein